MQTSQVLDTCSGASFSALDPLAPDVSQSGIEKDLSYLLRYDIYHPLAQVDIPPALRSEFLAPTSDQSLQSCLASLERLLTEGHFLLAAYLSAKILTSSLISPTDVKLILALFYTRLASLELSGNTVLAAQESKALEDLSSAFYYIEPGPQVSESGDTQKHPTYARHIVPWCLRVLAIRLQSIGFGDSRRGIGGLYEIGLEARREIMRPDLTDEERRIWKERLSDLGIRSVNALIEMGDLNAARRSLSSLRTPSTDTETAKLRKALLYLLIGDLHSAKQVVGDPDEAEHSIFPPLLSMAEGRYDDAVAGWRALLGREPKRSDESMISQNLAVCLLYTGQLNEARQVLEELVRENNSFGSLVFNLSTVYELCSDKSPNMKAELVDVISKQPVTGHTNLDRPNADFKL
jgi:tetratricopeptide (TPR) repeat protein